MTNTKADVKAESESAHPVTHQARTPSEGLGADFATTLRAMRKRRRLSQLNLATEIHFNRTQVTHVETGGRRPSFTFAERADKALGAEGQLIDLWTKQWAGEEGPASTGAEPTEQLLDSNDDVQSALWTVVDEASRFIVCSGSRSRDEAYLRLIEDRLRAEPGLSYCRLLFGPPHHSVLRDHLLRVLEIRDPRRTAHGAGKSIFLGMFDDLTEEPERFVCANEHRAVLPLLSLNGLALYDTALVVNDPGRAEKWASRLREAYHAGRRIETAQAIRALPILKDEIRDDAVPA